MKGDFENNNQSFDFFEEFKVQTSCLESSS
jgi:hypothetical protein